MNDKLASDAVLLDTCAIIWWSERFPISRRASEAIKAAAKAGAMCISAVSAWEIGLLGRPGRWGSGKFLPDTRTWFGDVMSWPGARATPLTHEVALESSLLPGGIHSDPADRLLVATARRLDVPLVTGDAKIIAYARQGWLKIVTC